MSVTERARELFEEGKRRRFGLWVRVDNAVLFGRAFAALSGHAVKVLLWSKMKVPLESKMDAKRRKKSGHAKPEPGPFSFTHSEAELFGLTRKQFASALRLLVEVGFLDVEHKGSGKQKDFSLFRWADRWKAYGTDRFEAAEFPGSLRHLPRDRDGRWIPTSSGKPVPPMADLINRAEKCPCDGDEIAPFKGRRVPLKEDYKGRKVPLIKGRNVPLQEGDGVEFWAEEEPLVADFGLGEAAG